MRRYLPGRDRLAELGRFSIAGGMSATVTLGLPVLLHEGFAVPERIAVAAALVTVFVMNFFVTRRFVYRSSGHAGAEALRFLGFSLISRSLEYGAFLLLFGAGLAYYVAQLIVVGVAFVTKFFLMRRIVYRMHNREGM